jgi:lyso-ornithine lipid O-acyltransferase
MADWFTGIFRLIALAWAIALALIEKKPGPSIRERAVWQQKQARRMLNALGTEVHMQGKVPAHGLIVANHLSYLDILVIASQAPMVFVSKSDVRQWPVIGLLLKSAGTILAERNRPMSATTTAGQIREVFESDLPVVLFPEGTSSDGRTVLPFKPTLFQIALDCQTTITPAAIHYSAEKGDIAYAV